MKNYVFPTRASAFSALVRAPLVPAALIFTWDAASRASQLGPLAIVGAAMFAIYILIVMEIFSLSIGGTIVALLWKRTSFSIVQTSLIGGIIAILPLLTLLLLLPDTNHDAWIDGKPTVIGGRRTSYGHWQDFKTLALVFAFGLIGGASFWWFGKPKSEKPIGIANDR